MLPQPPSLRVPTIPVATGFCESRLRYTFSCHRKLSKIVGTKQSASKTTVITVASFYPLNSVCLQYSGLKYYLHSVHSLRWSNKSVLNRQDRKQLIKICRLLEICGWLKNTHWGSLSTSFAPEYSKKGLKSVSFGSFYTKRSKCFDLHGYRALSLLCSVDSEEDGSKHRALKDTDASKFTFTCWQRSAK